MKNELEKELEAAIYKARLYGVLDILFGALLITGMIIIIYGATVPSIELILSVMGLFVGVVLVGVGILACIRSGPSIREKYRELAEGQRQKQERDIAEWYTALDAMAAEQAKKVQRRAKQ